MLRAERHPPKMYIFLSGSTIPNEKGTYDMFLTYDDQIDVWRKVGEASNSRFTTLIAMNRSSYMFNSCSNVVSSFDLISKTWKEADHPRTIRQHYHVMRNKNCIFAVGGHPPMSFSSSLAVEYYHPPTNIWLYASPLPFISTIGCAVAKGKLYAIGVSLDFARLEMRAIVYNSLFEAWCGIPSPNIYRTGFATVAYNESVFILGGRSDDNNRILTDVEKYDPLQNVWITYPDLLYNYLIPKAVIIEDTIVVYENHKGGEGLLRHSAIIWDEGDFSWKNDIFSRFKNLYRYNFCIIDDPFILTELGRENQNPALEWIHTPF